MKRWTKGMRDAYFDSLFKLAKKNKNIILLVADTGAICHDEFKQELSKQYINMGIAEQNMIGVAAGLALTGKIVYTYAIIPFITMRCYEQIRVDLCCMNLPVTVVGIGAGYDYSTLGPTHHGTEDFALMRAIPHMSIYTPSDNLMASVFAEVLHREKGPKYIRLDRTGFPLVYKNKKDIDIFKGFTVFKKSKHIYIISTGRMVCTALKVAENLSNNSVDIGVIDLFRIKPLNKKDIWDVIKHSNYLITLEEHFQVGGIGDAIGKILLNKRKFPAFKSLGIKNEFCRNYGLREYLYKENRIDTDSVTKIIKEWTKI